MRALGAGGMGSVFEARHVGTGRRVAVKVMSDALATNDEMLVRFQREARALGAIETQHIVQVFDLGVDRSSGHPYMVMELLTGTDLDAHIKRTGPLPPDLALRVVAQACLGLEKAHAAGIVHRDIKPANLFLAERDGGELVVKLLDFGIARMRKHDPEAVTTGELTQTGATIGSPQYMSPEQAKGLRSLDHRSDIWSLGVVLYKALCGKTPHHVHKVLGQLIVAICTEPAPPLQDLAPWVPPEIAAIAHKALALDPDQRYASAGDMLAAIQPFLQGGTGLRKELFVPLPERERLHAAPRLPMGGRAPMPSTTAPPLATSGPLRDLEPGSPRARTRTATMVFAGIVMIAISAVTLLTFRFTSSDPPRTEAPTSAAAAPAASPSSKPAEPTAPASHRVPEPAPAQPEAITKAMTSAAPPAVSPSSQGSPSKSLRTEKSPKPNESADMTVRPQF
ncbi:serine/threonine-protein kinase [Polyangium sp. 15x6]|uniref:serine/threonine-protein kinase n=1 Tax=Polyangium sp. 15x6 TaxID=3042687 RepID=UPI00249C3AF6|nr:serine/threonine-protein kinase [Polyangium sp. 15x6]MDI3287729.1 protein kinase [Polyangium sp. 15x6]